MIITYQPNTLYQTPWPLYYHTSPVSVAEGGTILLSSVIFDRDLLSEIEFSRDMAGNVRIDRSLASTVKRN